MKALLHKLFSWCPLFKAAVGGYWYYNYIQERRYTPGQFCSCGKDVKIGGKTRISCPARMKIGDGVFIGENCYISAVGGLQLGNNCALASYVNIRTFDHHFRGAESIPWGEARIVKPVVLEDCVWIGRHAFILPGITIGEGAIVGLGAVVTKDVPQRAIVAGNPAKIVGYRDKEEYESLKKSGAVRPASRPCTRVRIPAEMRCKYGELLQEVGYDVETGREYFEFTGTD